MLSLQENKFLRDHGLTIQDEPSVIEDKILKQVLIYRRFNTIIDSNLIMLRKTFIDYKIFDEFTEKWELDFNQILKYIEDTKNIHLHDLFIMNKTMVPFALNKESDDKWFACFLMNESAEFFLLFTNNLKPGDISCNYVATGIENITKDYQEILQHNLCI